MLRAGALMATLLVLVPVTGSPLPGRLLVLREVWPDFLSRLTSALEAGATLFGIALFAMAFAACYIYCKNRNFGQFIDVVLKGSESQNGAKPIDSQCYTPISLSQNFHFGRPQASSKNQTLTSVNEAFSKEKSDLVTVKEIYDSSDSEGNVNESYKGLTIRSRAYVLPSRSNGSIRSFCDDICDVSSADEITMENEFLNQPNIESNEKVFAPVVHQPVHCTCDEQKHNAISDELWQLKKPRISKSKSDNDIMSSSSTKLHAFHKVTLSD